jgi:hypothetical protein
MKKRNIARRALRKVTPATLAMASLPGALSVLAPAAAQESKPAVSEPNLKGGLHLGHAQVTGDTSNGFTWYGQGAFTLPIGKSFGVQVEGALGSLQGRFLRGAGVHAFWRDPDFALLGATFQYQGLAGATVLRTGGEAEWYAGRFTLAAQAGYQGGNPNDSKTIRPGQGAYGLLDLRYYPLDDLMLHVGGGFAPLRKGRYEGIVRFGAEYQPSFSPIRGLTLFVEGDVGTYKHHIVTAGIRFYFGFGSGLTTKPLIRRHREDDPPFMTQTATQGFQQGATGAGPQIPSVPVTGGEGCPPFCPD